MVTNTLVKIEKEKQSILSKIKNKWIQSFEFGFIEFITNETRERMTFQTLRPQNLEPCELEIIKQGMELLEISGKKIEAVKTKITLPGFLSKFWAANYWFRKDDGILLKFVGKTELNGPEVITILEEEIKNL